MPFARQTAIYTDKRVGPQTNRARLKKVQIDVEGQKLIAIYERGHDTGTGYRTVEQLSDVHIALTPGDIPLVGQTSVNAFLTDLHNFIVSRGDL